MAALLTSDEYDLWQITKVGTTCPVCAPLEGRVYSKSGTNPDYPPLTVAFGKVDPYGSNDLSNTYLNIHPNCLHSLVKYTTIGKSAEQIQKDKDFSNVEKNPLSRDPRTKKQIAAYREKEKNRQQLLRDMKQHKEYRAILENDVPKDFAKFRELKYNKAEKWNVLQKVKRTYTELNKKDWSNEFKEQSRRTYDYFREKGVLLSTHALSRMPRLNKSGYPKIQYADVEELLTSKAGFREDNVKEIYFSEEKQLAIIKNIETQEVVSIVRRKKIKEDWKRV